MASDIKAFVEETPPVDTHEHQGKEHELLDGHWDVLTALSGARAWAIDPHTTVNVARRFLHAVAASKLFAFGGDDRGSTTTVGDAWQARPWLTRALEAEVAEGDMSERGALAVARHMMRANQYACFDVEGTRRAVADHTELTVIEGGRTS